MKLRFSTTLVLLLLAGAPLLADDVPLTNPGFEAQFSGWTSPAGKEKVTAQISAEAAHSGGSGLRVMDDSETDGVDVESAALSASPSQIYTVHFWARCVSGKGVGVYLRFYDANGKWLNTIEAKNLIVKDVPPEPRDWKSYTLSGPTPPNAITMKVAIHSYGKAEVLADLDDFEITAVAKS